MRRTFWWGADNTRDCRCGSQVTCEEARIRRSELALEFDVSERRVAGRRRCRPSGSTVANDAALSPERFDEATGGDADMRGVCAGTRRASSPVGGWEFPHGLASESLNALAA